MTPNKGPLISAIVCTRNRAASLDRTLASLECQTLPLNAYEVVVVDNASSDETRATVRRHAEANPNVRYVCEAALGLSNARNRGFREACAPVVAFIDDDADADAGWLAALHDAFRRTVARPLAVGGRVLPVWGAPRPRWLPEASLITLSLVDHGPEARVVSDPGRSLVGCNLAFERAYLLEVGGFNPHLGRRDGNLLSGEESAVLRRLLNDGGTMLYDPTVVVNHHIPPERLRLWWFFRRSFWQARTSVRFGVRSYPPFGPRTVAWLSCRLLLHVFSVAFQHSWASVFRSMTGAGYDLGLAVGILRRTPDVVSDGQGEAQVR